MRMHGTTFSKLVQLCQTVKSKPTVLDHEVRTCTHECMVFTMCLYSCVPVHEVY